MFIPKLRKIEQVVADIKKIDPNTELNRRMILQLISEGLLTATKYGNAWLINVDELYSLFYREVKKWKY